ncbi:MAG: AAA family ATPase [Acidobacteria bacterium]|nr:AAA family ATPase [Acidobacteriota bacterium]
MEPAQFLTTSGVIIVAGKGGVGKTTVTAALAVAASSVGLRVLIVEVEGKDSMASAFETGRLSYDEQVLVEAARDHAGVHARTVTPDDALLDYLNERGLQRLSKRLVSSGLLDMISTAIPGIRDILVLGKVKQLERSGTFDLVLVDAPAAGHAITFLQSASGLLDAVAVGPINAQARDVQDLLGDPDRCRILLVTAPEETPVNELVETAYSLEDRVGVALGPVVVNGVHPPLAGLAVDPEVAAAAAGVALVEGEAEALRGAARFRTARSDLQQEQLTRLAEELPLPQLLLPDLFTSDLGRAGLDTLAAALIEQLGSLESEPRA